MTIPTSSNLKPHMEGKLKYISQCKLANYKGLKSMNLQNNTLIANQKKEEMNFGDDSSEGNSVSEGDSSDDENVLIIKPSNNQQSMVDEDDFFDAAFEE